MRRVLVFSVLLTLWSPHALAQDAQERIRRTQRVIVSTLDEGLPDLPLDGWLRDVLGPSAQYEWTSGSCAGQRDRDDPAVPLCGIVAATNSERTVTIGIRLGEYGQETKADRWATPRLDQAFIGRGRHLVLLDRLRDLPRMLTLSPQQWPARDIALEAVRCQPERPQPLDEVTCIMSLINRGDAASLARVFVDVQPNRSFGGDGVVKLQAHAAKNVRLMFPWPDEAGATVTAGLEIDDRSPYHRVNERGALTLTRGEDLDLPGDLVGWVDDEHALRPILSARVTLADARRATDVPVDSSISRLLVSVESLPGVTATLLRPGGAPVGEMDGDTSISDLRTMDLVAGDPGEPAALHDLSSATWYMAGRGRRHRRGCRIIRARESVGEHPNRFWPLQVRSQAGRRARGLLRDRRYAAGGHSDRRGAPVARSG